MTMLKIVTLPTGNAKLRRTSVKVRKSKLPEVQKLIPKMFEVLKFYRGIGLAAPQVGIGLRIIVVDLFDGSPNYTMINPEILETEGEQESEEACLSIPYGKGSVKRANKIKVRYLDYFGVVHELGAEGLLSRVIQHEIDHLDGKLYIDYLSKLKKEIIAKKIKKQRRNFIPQQLVMVE